MLFKFRTVMVFDRTIECDDHEHAIKYAKVLEDEANANHHHGETTTVRVLGAPASGLSDDAVSDPINLDRIL